ncbi:MAG: aspartate/glutamate racemase family protein, partial [Candidatus Aminicenantes bacterium]|nr:aspartate/glutamate racemase family protein [Candidatus Aminicenantes bacterium]
MKIRKNSCLATMALTVLAAAVFLWPDDARAQRSGAGLDGLFQKSRVTVAVTDSGLGGLSVMAEAARRMKDSGIFERVEFLFFNALFKSGSGYNSLKTREEKIRVFDSALACLEEKYRPDIILIGCNTLSVLYEDTPFSQKTKTPVIGIVDTGVELISAGLRQYPEASVIIFGTPTTISEGTYARELEKQRFAPERIHSQSCPELESFIERDHLGDETGMLVAGYVGEALQNIEKSGRPLPRLIISLNCTHYGYAMPLWEKAFEEEGVKPLEILNPNSRMTDPLFEKRYAGRYKKTAVSARVVSMVGISPAKIESLGKWLQNL